jgi:hypothetical protein
MPFKQAGSANYATKVTSMTNLTWQIEIHHYGFTVTDNMLELSFVGIVSASNQDGQLLHAKFDYCRSLYNVVEFRAVSMYGPVSINEVMDILDGYEPTLRQHLQNIAKAYLTSISNNLIGLVNNPAMLPELRVNITLNPGVTGTSLVWRV